MVDFCIFRQFRFDLSIIKISKNLTISGGAVEKLEDEDVKNAEEDWKVVAFRMGFQGRVQDKLIDLSQ